MKVAVVLLVLLGVVAAGAAALVVGAIKNGPEARSPEAQTVTALIAQRDLAAMTILTEDAVRAEMIPRSALPRGYLINPVQAIGKILRVEVMKGQVLADSSLAVPGSAADSLPRIPPGMRVVTVPVSSRSVSGGFLCPGCLVDVITTTDEPGASSRTRTTSRVLLQRTKVWGVDDETIVSVQAQEDKAVSKRIASNNSGNLRVTLLVDTRQAEALQAAMNRGSITLAIRNPLDEAIEESNDVPVEKVPPPSGPDDRKNEPQAVEPPPAPRTSVEVIKGPSMTNVTFPSTHPAQGSEDEPFEPNLEWPAGTPQTDKK